MSVLTETPLLVAPDNDLGLSLTCTGSGGPEVDLGSFGSWVEFVASTSGAATIAGVSIDEYPATTGTRIVIQYGIGGSGAEAPIDANDAGQFISSTNGDANHGDRVHLLPVPIGPLPSGARISLRVRSNKTISSGLVVTLLYYEDFDSSHQAFKPQAFAPATTRGADITPNGTAYTASAWVEVIASFPGHGALTGISVSTPTTADTIWEIGFGAASSEVVVTTLRARVIEAAVGVPDYDFPAPFPVPIGTRVSVRLKKSGTNTATTTATVRYVLINLATVLQKVTQQVLLVWHDQLVEDEIGEGNVTIGTCTGGGTVPSGSDPSDGEDLSTAEAPIPWIAITIGSTTYRYAAATVSHSPARYGRVISFGTAHRDLSEPDAGPKASTMTVSLADTDRVLRGLANGGTLKHALFEAFVSDKDTIVAEGTPFRVFRGRVSSWKAEAGLGFTINAEDELTARLTSLDAEDLQLGITTLDRVSDANPEELTKGKPAPEVYGNVSDEDTDDPQGVMQLPYSAAMSFAGAEDLGNNHVFPICIGAIGQIQCIFGASPFEDPPVSRVRIPDSAWGVWAWAPHKPGWFGDSHYWEDPDTLQRWTIVVLEDGHPTADLAREGRIPLTANVCGYETVGDGSAGTIGSIPRGFLHWINNRVLQDASTTAWPVTIFASGAYSFIKTSTFEDVHDQLDALGWELGGVLGADLQLESWRDRWAVWLRHMGYGTATGMNRHGQLILMRLDRTESYSDAPSFGPGQILERGCEVDNRDDAVENSIRYVSRRNYRTKLQGLNPGEGERGLREPYDGPWLYVPDAIEDSGSITALGGDPRGRRRSAIQEYELTRDIDTADALAEERLDWLKPANGRAQVTFDLSLRDAWDLELGDVIALEHWDLPWSGSRKCQVRGLAWNLDTHVVTVRVWDVDDLVA